MSRSEPCTPLHSELFYGGQLLHGVTPEDRPCLVPRLPPIAAVDSTGEVGLSLSGTHRSTVDISTPVPFLFALQAL
jgi:hypothetical protein